MTEAALLDYAGTDFARGAQVCREMMARFVEQGGDANTAASIRDNWHPGWGDDPGQPPEVLDTWEAPECPEGEANYAEYCKAVAGDPDHTPDISPQGLSATARMLERWAIPMLPANRLGQVPFLRGLIECAVRDLRLVAIRDGGFMDPALALGIAARSDETPQAAQPAGQEPGPEGERPTPVSNPQDISKDREGL